MNTCNAIKIVHDTQCASYMVIIIIIMLIVVMVVRAERNWEQTVNVLKKDFFSFLSKPCIKCPFGSELKMCMALLPWCPVAY